MIQTLRLHIDKMIKVTMAAAAATCLMACSSDDDAPVVNPEDNYSIKFGIETNDFDGDSRAFITGTPDLEAQCTPGGSSIDAANDNSERIGILADLWYKNQTNRKEDRYLNHWLFKDGAGWNYYEEGKTPDNTKKHWIRGTYMICSAYYPAKHLKESKYITPESTNGDVMSLSYSAVQCQHDLMVGYNVIDSDKRLDKDGNELQGEKKTIVPIKMQHALAALKFQFKSPNSESDDFLTKVWLDDNGTENDPDYFAVVGQMSYKTKLQTVGGKETFSKDIKWEKARAYVYENYVWENTNGIPLTFSPEKMAVPYLEGNNTNAAGDKYSNNDGFILIIPQKIPDKLYLCFTTKYGGSKKIIKQKLLLPETTPGRLTEWLPNNRYIYTITLTPAGISLSVDVQPWNEIKSNSSVEFD